MDKNKFANAELFFSELAECILVGGAYKATKFINPKLTIKATRKRLKGKIDKRSKIVEILFTVGAPNYKEREYLKKEKKAGRGMNTGYVHLKFVKV